MTTGPLLGGLPSDDETEFSGQFPLSRSSWTKWRVESPASLPETGALDWYLYPAL